MITHLLLEIGLLAGLVAGAPAEPRAAAKKAFDPEAGRPLAAEPAEKPAVPEMKTPQAAEKLKEAMGKLEARDYAGARTILAACLKDAAAAKDRKIIQGLIEDAKLGAEIEAARKMADGKKEKKAIARVEAAIKKSPESFLVPAARKFIAETEELIYCVLDDFEPGDTLETETAPGDEESEGAKRPGFGFNQSRWRYGMTYNSDPAHVLHGKGSMRWAVGGGGRGGVGRGGGGRGGGPGMPGQFRGYRSVELKKGFHTRWRYLAFYVFLPEASEGTFQVTLSPTAEAVVDDSLHTQKLVDLRGKTGWLPVVLDLSKDFGNTQNVKLEDVRYVRIEYNHVNRRVLYLDFVHLE